MANPLKEWRSKRGMSLRELAQLSGLNPATISKLENDHTKALDTTLHKLAAALDVPVEDFASLRDTTVKERAQLGGRASVRKRQEQKEQAAQEGEDKDESMPENRAA